MAESWEELSLVSASPTLIKKGIEGVVMKHVSKTAKPQKGIGYIPSTEVYILFIISAHISVFISFSISWPVPTTSDVLSGGAVEIWAKVQEAPAVRPQSAGTLTVHLCAHGGTDYTFSGSSSCKSSVERWYILLCTCSMFYKAQCLGDTHCYALVRLHRTPRALHNQTTVCAWLCTGWIEVKQAWKSSELLCRATAQAADCSVFTTWNKCVQ